MEEAGHDYTQLTKSVVEEEHVARLAGNIGICVQALPSVIDEFPFRFYYFHLRAPLYDFVGVYQFLQDHQV